MDQLDRMIKFTLKLLNYNMKKILISLIFIIIVAIIFLNYRCNYNTENNQQLINFNNVNFFNPM